MWHRKLAALVLAACSEATAPAPVIVAPPAAPARDPAITAPHGSEIAIVAITDDAGAALTADDRGELRLWPALDGTREPVVIRGHAPRALAIVRAPDGFVAALLDAATGIEVMRIADDGAVHGRQLADAEPGFVELAATADALLARRADQAVVRLDTAQVLAPARGQQLLAVAARGVDAVAAIGDPERPDEIHAVREIAIGRDLAWGAIHPLPVPLRGPIALSPSGRRIAGIHARTSAGVVIELGATPRVVATDPSAFAADDETTGFLDDDRIVFRGGVVVTMAHGPIAADPWAGARSGARVRLGRDAAIGDGAAIGGIGTHLVIARESETRFLGYRDLGTGQLRVTGAEIMLDLGSRVLWLDAQLRMQRSGEAVAETPVLPPARTTADPVLGTDRTGTRYTLATNGTAKAIVAHAAEVRRIAVDRDAIDGAVDDAGTWLAVHTERSVILYDMAGRERWRVPAWSVTMATFTADGGTLLVNTQGGLMALETMTGARRATGCGWGFGLATVEPTLAVFAEPIVCAEAP